MLEVVIIQTRASVWVCVIRSRCRTTIKANTPRASLWVYVICPSSWTTIKANAPRASKWSYVIYPRSWISIKANTPHMVRKAFTRTKGTIWGKQNIHVIQHLHSQSYERWNVNKICSWCLRIPQIGLKWPAVNNKWYQTPIYNAWTGFLPFQQMLCGRLYVHPKIGIFSGRRLYVQA